MSASPMVNHQSSIANPGAGYAVTIEDVRQAAKRIKPYAHRTPIMTSSHIDELAGRSIFFKCEIFQKIGAFKFRGACNAVMKLSDEAAKRGVVTHSSGNHAQALALAAKLRGIAAHIVMPKNSSAVKIRAVEGYGAKVYLCEPNQMAREGMAADIATQTAGTLIPPYNDANVIAGQGTIALELLEDVPAPGLDAIIVPIGGGGMISGICIAAHGFPPLPLGEGRGEGKRETRPSRSSNTSKNLPALTPNPSPGRRGEWQIKIIAAEPAGADDAARSLATGELVPQSAPKTIADGLLTGMGDLTWPIVRDHVERVITVSDEEIIAAMRLVWERMKLVIEPSAAVGVAVALSDDFRSMPGMQRIGVVLCGGNVDLDHLPW